MIADAGRAALLVALILASYGVAAGIFAGRTRRDDVLLSVRRAAWACFALVLVAAAALIASLVAKDYSLRFVALYTSNDAPLNYAVTSMWAGNAGSLLLWVVVLMLFTSIVALTTRHQYRELAPYALAVLMGVGVFFLTMINFLDSPFQRLPVPPPDGRGLNPLLENYWMQIHPPALYLGYVSAAVPFAFAVAALVTRRLDAEWIKGTHRWTLLTWAFLSLGNLLGAKWAYETLGWGGYWGWDPVENAAIMPWFTATAFLHSVMIQERRGMMKVWNVSLIVATFCLTIFGTFLVRSGVLTSVHSFGLSNLGPFFFGFLGFVILGSIALIVSRLKDLRSEATLDSVLSRESSFLVNNLLLIGAAFAIFWGTVYPLVSEATRGLKVTVGAPYYDEVVGPILLAIFLLMGIGPLIAWRRATAANLVRNFRFPIGVGLAALLACIALGLRQIPTLLAAPVLGFVLGGVILEFARGARARVRGFGEPWPTAFARLFARHPSRYGGYLVHVGMILIAVGVIGSKVYQDASEATLQPGGSTQIGGYTLRYEGLNQTATATREVNRATVAVLSDGRQVGTLYPEKNFFPMQQQPQTIVGLRSTLADDLYVVLAAWQPSGEITLKSYLNPLVAWIWIGGAVALLGSLVCFLPGPRPARTRRTQDEATPRSCDCRRGPVTNTLLLALAFAAAAFIFVGWPFFQGRPRPQARRDDALAELRRKRDSIYAALRELEFDARTGKISPKDHAELSESYKRQAIALLKQLDERTRDELLAIDDEIEREVASRRTTTRRRTGLRCVACGAAMDASDRFCRQCGVPRSRSCTRCGAAVETGDRFCPRCGAGL
ncbi:MAG: cytochrome c biogenesis protein CcmF [Dehalococcoidia bacterium]|nr:MAG: cytochrome c biogenesis protein CcmF [Dehalococcoidia bacterium]